MAKFDYMNFSVGGYDTEFVAHAGKYTEEQVINLCIRENDWKFKPNYCNGKPLRMPTIADVKLRHVRWYVKTPDFCFFFTYEELKLEKNESEFQHISRF